jgi:hypothetical protein
MRKAIPTSHGMLTSGCIHQHIVVSLKSSSTKTWIPYLRSIMVHRVNIQVQPRIHPPLLLRLIPPSRIVTSYSSARDTASNENLLHRPSCFLHHARLSEKRAHPACISPPCNFLPRHGLLRTARPLETSPSSALFQSNKRIITRRKTPTARVQLPEQILPSCQCQPNHNKSGSHRDSRTRQAVA